MADIVVINRIFPKYRKDILSALHEQIDFVFLHSQMKSGIKQVTAPFSWKVGSIKYASNHTNLFLNVFPYILRHRPKIIIHEFSMGIASLIPTLLWSKLLGSKIILWGHGYDHKSGGFHPDRSFKDRLGLFLMKRVDAVIFYGDNARQIMSGYVDKEKLFVAFNCLNTNDLSKIRHRLEMEGSAQVKKRLGFTHQYNLIYIGRLLKTKKPHLLIEMLKQLQGKYGGRLGIHFVGDGEEMASLKESVRANELEEDVIFHGAIYDDVLNGEMLYASDLMIMPGYVGLSVNHALNFDCPVMTFKQKENGPFHSPEIEYLVDGQTGFIVEEHSAEALAKTVDQYLSDEQLTAHMQVKIREMIEKTCSLENFIKGFAEARDYVLKSSKK